MLKMLKITSVVNLDFNFVFMQQTLVFKNSGFVDAFAVLSILNSSNKYFVC